MTITRKRRRRKNSLHSWLICIALIASFGLMGFSFAFFQNAIWVSGTTSTGDVGARFVDNYKLDAVLVDRGADRSQELEQLNKASFSAMLGRNGDIKIKIEDAYPGDVYKLYYAVENTGNAPIMIRLEKNVRGQVLKLANKWDGHYTDDIDSLLPGDILPGILVISVGESSAEPRDETEFREYEISLELHYKLRVLR